MNKKEAEKIQPGALVRYSYTREMGTATAIVLAKRYEKATKTEAILCHPRPDRYILTISWLQNSGVKNYRSPGIVDEVSSWDMMVVSHTK